jgi:hypothetical protein
VTLACSNHLQHKLLQIVMIYSRQTNRFTQLHQQQIFSRFPQVFSILYLVFSAAASCRIFAPRSMRAHYLQPPAQLGFTLSQRSLELASLQRWCCGNQQRMQLLRCSSPLSVMACRLAHAFNRREGSRVFELRVVTRIFKRSFGGFVWQFWKGIERENEPRSAGVKRRRQHSPVVVN